MRSVKHHRLRLPLRALSTSTPPSSTAATPITSLLIANRGEIAIRIHRTASRLGIPTTTLFTDVDASAPHASCAPRSLALGAPSAYLDGERIIDLARRNGIQALHPGYGFLSENSGFAERCADAGIVFVGPPPRAMADMGDKARSKEIMNSAGVPCVPGYHGEEQGETELLERAKGVGFPVLLKSVKGGGGKGMRIVSTPDEFTAQLRSARAEAKASFGPGGEVMLVERYIQRPRHVEVQVFADKHGNCVALGERDCSVQRRHQKIIEESPAPGLEPELREDLWEKARTAALAVGYVGAGTVEFILDRDTGEFFFMEMNTRLQVEHPVSEMVTGTDLVEWQLRVAAGEKLPLSQEDIAERIKSLGWAIEARIYAESPERGFLPDSGRLLHLQTPKTSKDVRIDAGFVEGNVVSEAYDGMIAKLIVRGPDRETTIRKMETALRDYEIVGLSTNIEFLKRLCRTQAFVDGDVETGFIDKWRTELFSEQKVDDEVFGQAAIGMVVKSAETPHGEMLGFGTLGERTVRFGVRGAEEKGEVVEVAVSQTSRGKFTLTIKRDGQDPTTMKDISSDSTSTLGKTSMTTYFPTQRVHSTIVQSGDAADSKITIFQHGRKTELSLLPPKWLDEALGLKEAASSVVAPMPCKILRNEVTEGEDVEKGSPLVVIESMKMETVIRSPQKGKIKKLAHKEGDICKAGTVLVLFEESDKENEG